LCRKCVEPRPSVIKHQKRISHLASTPHSSTFVTMMKLLLITLLCLLAAFQTSAFAPRPAVLTRPTAALSTTTSLNVFGNKKSAASKAAKAARDLEEEAYWQGDWVCKDCGYIYNRVRYIMQYFRLFGAVTSALCSSCNELAAHFFVSSLFSKTVRPNAPECSLKSKGRVSVALSALDRVVAMLRKLETELERLSMVEMHPF
jgi:hypothetical protein